MLQGYDHVAVDGAAAFVDVFALIFRLMLALFPSVDAGKVIAQVIKALPALLLSGLLVNEFTALDADVLVETLFVRSLVLKLSVQIELNIEVQNVSINLSAPLLLLALVAALLEVLLLPDHFNVFDSFIWHPLWLHLLQTLVFNILLEVADLLFLLCNFLL